MSPLVTIESRLQIEYDLDWIDDQINALLEAHPPRDGFYHHLIVQELPFWLMHVTAGTESELVSEASDLSVRRGFNANERMAFKGIAVILTKDAERIRAVLNLNSSACSITDATFLCRNPAPAQKA